MLHLLYNVAEELARLWAGSSWDGVTGFHVDVLVSVLYFVFVLCLSFGSGELLSGGSGSGPYLSSVDAGFPSQSEKARAFVLPKLVG